MTKWQVAHVSAHYTHMDPLLAHGGKGLLLEVQQAAFSTFPTKQRTNQARLCVLLEGEFFEKFLCS